MQNVWFVSSEKIKCRVSVCLPQKIQSLSPQLSALYGDGRWRARENILFYSAHIAGEQRNMKRRLATKRTKHGRTIRHLDNRKLYTMAASTSNDIIPTEICIIEVNGFFGDLN